MGSTRLREKVFRFAAIVIFAAALISCGGGSGGSGVTAEPVGSGSVAVLLTDGPTGDFSSIIVTVSRVELLSEGGKVALFSGEKTFDLLKLSTVSSLFSVSSSVPSGWYDKLRLYVTELKLIKKDGTVIYPKLPKNGRIDLNPRRSFFVEADHTMVLQVDLDAEKSIHVVQAGKSGKYVFRPVVFVKIVERVIDGRLVRVTGYVSDKDTEGGVFKLCPKETVFKSSYSVDGTDTDPELLGAGACVPVVVDEDTSFFDDNGEPTDFSYLMENDRVTVVGKVSVDYGSGHDVWDDYTEKYGSSMIVLDATVVEAGDFLRLAGTTDSSVDGTTGRFEYLVDPGQGISPADPLAVQVQDGTKVFSKSGAPLGADDIKKGLRAIVDGVLRLSGTDPDVLNAALVLLDTTAEEPVKLDGMVSTIDPDARTFTLVSEGSPDVCIKVADDAFVFLVSSTDGGFVSAEIPLSGLTDGQTVEVYGNFEAGGCLVAKVVLASPPSGGI